MVGGPANDMAAGDIHGEDRLPSRDDAARTGTIAILRGHQDLDLLRRRTAPVRTDEDTVALVRRLAIHYPDAVIAAFSIGNNARPPMVIASPQTTSAICVATGTAIATSRRLRHPKAKP